MKRREPLRRIVFFLVWSWLIRDMFGVYEVSVGWSRLHRGLDEEKQNEAVVPRVGSPGGFVLFVLKFDWLSVRRDDLHSLICRKEKKKWKSKRVLLNWGSSFVLNEGCTLPLWWPPQRWWSPRIAAWSGPALYSPCTALTTPASGSGSPRWHSYLYSNT